MKPIGKGSDTTDAWGFTFSLLLGHLESLRDHELERSEDKPLTSPVRKRAEKLSDLVDELSAMDLTGE
jgi:hypothetical protein